MKRRCSRSPEGPPLSQRHKKTPPTAKRIAMRQDIMRKETMCNVQLMRQLEAILKNRVTATGHAKFSIIYTRHRGTLIKFMVLFCNRTVPKSGLHVLSAGVNYMDRYISTCGRRIEMDELPCLAASCLWIASKTHDDSPMDISVVAHPKYRRQDVIDMERSVLRVLKYEMISLLPVDVAHMCINEVDHTQRWDVAQSVNKYNSILLMRLPPLEYDALTIGVTVALVTLRAHDMLPTSFLEHAMTHVNLFQILRVEAYLDNT